MRKFTAYDESSSKCNANFTDFISSLSPCKGLSDCSDIVRQTGQGVTPFYQMPSVHIYCFTLPNEMTTFSVIIQTSILHILFTPMKCSPALLQPPPPKENIQYLAMHQQSFTGWQLGHTPELSSSSMITLQKIYNKIILTGKRN